MSDLHMIRKHVLEPGGQFEIEEHAIDGVLTRVWKSAPANLRDVFEASRGFGERSYLVYEDESLCYARHYRRTLALASVLHSRFAVVKGDRVAIAMRNYPEYATIFWASVCIGAIVVPLNAWWSAREFEFALCNSGAKVVFADRERLGVLSDILPAGASTVGVRAGDASVPDFEQLIDEGAAGEAWPECRIEPEDAATIIYTSGTTGEPKGALGTHRNITSTLWTTLFSLTCARIARDEAPPARDALKGALITSPLFHVMGLFSGLVVLTYVGHKLVLMRKWDANRAAQLIEREKITSMTTVPTIAWELIEVARAGRYDLSSLERLTIGGVASPPELTLALARVLPGVMLGTGWGMTETASPTTHVYGAHFEQRPDSAGLVTPVCEVRIVDAAGDDTPAGAVGELWVKGPNVARGYWGLGPGVRSFAGGWVKTGDFVRSDEEGYLYIVDRAKDMIIRGGENVYCLEVENAIMAFGGIVEVALVGLPHATLGEEVAAVVHAQLPIDIKALQAHLETRLAHFKIPSVFDIRERSLPRNPAGKVLKGELRNELGGRRPQH